MMKYMLVLKFEESAIKCFDDIIDIENKIRISIAQANHSLLDGHDFGCGEMNMFIHTDEPELAFNLVRIELGNSKFYVHRAAYRKLEGNSYEMLYPEDCSDRCRVI